MVTQPEFLLSKWYLDCVTENGDAFIGYTATLRWKLLNLNYASMMTHGALIGDRTKTALQETCLPAISPGEIHWSPPSLRLQGHWISLLPGVERELFNSSNGILMWKCLQPHARVSVDLDHNSHIEGLGYAEKIDLSIPPWQLPITGLLWGRFLSGRESLVWIRWDADGFSKMHLFLNGREVNECSISETGITLDHGRIVLTLRETSVLREGPLVSSALSMIPGIDRLLPEKVVNTFECKWLSKGRLTREGAPSVEGWTIHEVVKFS